MSDFLFVKKTTKKNNDFNLEIVMFIYWDVAYNFKNVLFVFLKSIIFLKILEVNFTNKTLQNLSDISDKTLKTERKN